MSHHVLIYGHDSILLSTREQLLKRAAFDVRTSATSDEAHAILSTRPVDVLILCHTVGKQERANILDIAHDRQKNLAVLFLSAALPVSDVGEKDAVFYTFDGPDNFLRTVCELTHEPAPSPLGSNSQNLGNELCHDLQAR